MPSVTIRTEADRQRAMATLAALNLDKDTGWVVTVDKEKVRRSRKQDGLYFKWLDKVVAAVRDVTGYEKDEIHEYLKARFLDPKIISIAGKAVERFSLRDLDTKAMAEYTDRVYRWATSELGLILPLPEEMHDYRRVTAERE